MTIHEHLSEFAGKRVTDYQVDEKPKFPCVFRLRGEYDGTAFDELLEHFLENEAGPEITALVIGSWVSEDVMEGGSEAVRTLCDAADKLPNLAHLFLGDIVMEESEISWINWGDLSFFWKAFPKLESFHLRGTTGLSLGKINHNNLRTFVLQSGGLEPDILQQVWDAKLPNLEHLELWLGSDNYGGIETAEPLQTLLEGKLFPKLRYLGLRNADRSADAVAVAIAKSPILKRMKTLDLSLGAMGDEGGKALLASLDVRKLERLDVHHHFMTDPVVAEFRKLGIEVDTSEQSKPHSYGGEEHRYNVVSE